MDYNFKLCFHLQLFILSIFRFFYYSFLVILFLNFLSKKKLNHKERDNSAPSFKFLIIVKSCSKKITQFFSSETTFVSTVPNYKQTQWLKLDDSIQIVKNNRKNLDVTLFKFSFKRFFIKREILLLNTSTGPKLSLSPK